MVADWRGVIKYYEEQEVEIIIRKGGDSASCFYTKVCKRSCRWEVLCIS